MNLKCERIPAFCYYCGLVGHNEKFFVKPYDNPEVKDDCEYGAWMKVELWHS